jgi:hypothetical protein
MYFIDFLTEISHCYTAVKTSYVIIIDYLDTGLVSL